MADEPLRMQAEVVDKFSGPLKSFRQHLLDATRAGTDHSETLTKGFGKVEGTLQTTARTAQTVLNPALAALGVTGIGAGVAIAGIAGALRNLSGNLTALGQLSRETGVAADTLRTFGAVAGKFNLDQQAVADGTKNFVANLREFRMHGNETFAWLQSQGRTAEGRSAFQALARDLRASTDAGEALKKALVFGEQIKDPTERGIFFQRLFGNADLARIADGHLGKVEEVWKKTQEKLPPLDPKAILKAEEFERAVSDLRGSMKSIGTTIASEVLPFASDFTKWIDDIVKDQRGDFLKGLRQGLKEVSAELRGVDWKSAGDTAKDMLVSTTALVGTLAKGLKDVADTVKFLREGEYWQALRQEGGNGALARKLAPRVGDDEIAAQEEVEKARKLRDAARDAGQHLIGRTQQRMGLLDDPVKAQQNLDAAEAKLRALRERSPEDRKRDFDASEKLRRSVDSLTDEMKAQRQGKDATAQKSSAEGDGPFGGARIQTAAFGGGGFRRFGGLGGGASLPGGGSGPGYVGEQGERDALRERFRQHLKRTVPGYDGGPVVPTGPDGRVPGMGGGSDGGERLGPIAPHRGSQTFDALAPRIMADLQKDFGLTREQAAGIVGNLGHESGGFRQMQERNPLGGGAGGYGYGQWTGPRRRQFFDYARENNLDPNSYEANYGFLRRELQTTERKSLNRLRGAQTSDEAMLSFEKNFERSGIKAYGSRKRFTDRAMRLPATEAGVGDRLPGIERPQVGAAETANGEGWAARERARKDFETKMREGDERLTASAGRAGIVATPKVENNGSVVVNVQKPGPDTKVSTSASGSLFRDVVMRRGQTMEKAGGA